MGPIQILLLGFGEFGAAGGLVDELASASETGTIRIVDARLLLRESADEVVAVRERDLAGSEHVHLRAAAGALVGLGAAGALGGKDDAAGGMVLAADAALDIDELGLSAAEIGQLAEELEVGDALLLLVIENVWAAGIADALRGAGVVFAQQDYLSIGGLVALGTMLGLDIALDG